ncbi:glycosyltransferase family 2 protein [Desulfobacterota bacterium M19]
MSKKNLSIAIITKNEEDRLPDCLRSTAFADEVVVVDSGSEDRTVEIAEGFGVRTFIHDWQGYGPQKQFAIDQSQGDWILVLDADERIPVKTAHEIVQIIKSSPSCSAYSIPRKNYFMNRWIKHAGWWPDRTVRLFRRNSAWMSTDRVHESLQINDQAAVMRNPIIHYPFRDLRHMMDKMNHYSSAGALDLYDAGVTASITKASGRAMWTILYNYLLRGGFLDGGPGFILAVSDAVNIFFKYVKLIEKHRSLIK